MGTGNCQTAALFWGVDDGDFGVEIDALEAAVNNPNAEVELVKRRIGTLTAHGGTDG